MIKTIYLAFFLIFCNLHSFSQDKNEKKISNPVGSNFRISDQNNSVLASGDWYKLAINADGIYKLDYTFLSKTLGLNLSSIDPRKIKLYGNGGGMLPQPNAAFRYKDLV